MKVFNILIILVLSKECLASNECNYDIRQWDEDKVLYIKRINKVRSDNNKVEVYIENNKFDFKNIPEQYYGKFTISNPTNLSTVSLREYLNGNMIHICSYKLAHYETNIWIDQIKQFLSFLLGAGVAIVSGLMLQNKQYRQKKRYYQHLFISILQDILSRWDYIDLGSLELEPELEHPHKILSEYFSSKSDKKFVDRFKEVLNAIKLAKSQKTNEHKNIISEFVKSFRR